MQGRPGAGDLWGKFRDESRGGPAWHPLIDHCTDVACVLEALLHQPTIRRRLARAGGLDDLDEVQVARLCFLAFIHDLGKCALGFRAKAALELGRTAGHLAALKPLLSGPLVQDLRNLLDVPQLHTWAGDALEALLDSRVCASRTDAGPRIPSRTRYRPLARLDRPWARAAAAARRAGRRGPNACLPKHSRTGPGRYRTRRPFSIFSPDS